MASIDSIALGNTNSLQTGDGFSALSADEFTQIILTELSNQDPLQPNDTSALLEQLSSIRNIQSDLEISDRLTTVVGASEFASAAGLIGARVSALDQNNREITGRVVSVIRTDDGPVLKLDSGARADFADVREILQDTEEPA